MKARKIHENFERNEDSYNNLNLGSNSMEYAISEAKKIFLMLKNMGLDVKLDGNDEERYIEIRESNPIYKNYYAILFIGNGSPILDDEIRSGWHVYNDKKGSFIRFSNIKKATGYYLDVIYASGKGIDGINNNIEVIKEKILSLEEEIKTLGEIKNFISDDH